MATNNSEKLKHLFDSIEKKRKCKTKVSSTTTLSDFYSINSPSNINELERNLKNFSDYKDDISNKYFGEFKITVMQDSKTKEESSIQDKKEKENILEIKKDFQKKFPYISGIKAIDNNSIKVPAKQYFMNNLFNGIISLFQAKKPYPVDKKYGLVYFRELEWIFFTIEELYYQKYLSDSTKIMAYLYEDYSKNVLNTSSFFTEEDLYILPSNLRAKIFEKNAFNYFLLKTKLKSGPDLLIKLRNKETNEEKINKEKKIIFSDYINLIKHNFDYLEIDGALINNTKEERSIKIEQPILTYETITFHNNNCEMDSKNCIIKKIIIPAYSVVFFQTKIKGPNIKLNKEEFNEKKLFLNEMKEELAVVLYKMIIYNKYFYELYIKLGLIDENYTAVFFLIFDDYPIKDISKKIKIYLDIFKNLNLLNYDFMIQPIYMSAFIEEINSQLNINEYNNNYNNMVKKYQELKKNEPKLKKQKNPKKMEGVGKRKEEEEEKKIIKNKANDKEKEIKIGEYGLKNKEEEIKSREEESKLKKTKDEEELMRKRENELNKKENELKKNEEEIIRKREEEEMIRRENELKKKEEEIIRKREEEEMIKRENELKKKEEEITRKKEEEEIIRKREEEEMIRRENELKKKEEKINKNLNNVIKECDIEADNYAKKIRADVESIVGLGFKFTKYKPIGYSKNIIDNIECYSFKVKIDKNKYIHIFKKGEKIEVIFGKTLFEPF